MNKIIAYIIVSIISNFAHAQNLSLTLNAEELLQIVRKFHPIVKQAQLNIDKADAEITIARGAFNPIIGNIISNKTFSNTEYYNLFNPNITIPTWYGIEFSSGLKNLSGYQYDPSETTGQTSFIGISIPLIKNLVLDKRRAYLKQSKLHKEMSVTEQNIAINNVLMEAAGQYWEWVKAYEVHELVKKNWAVSIQRFEMIKKTIQNGERAAIDSVEALTQLQNFEFQKNETWLSLQKENLELNAFLWKENNSPYELPAEVVPSKKWDDETVIESFNLNLNDLLATAQKNHPELKLYNQKLNFLSIDKELKFQELLPKLDFKYNHLTDGYTFLKTENLLFKNNFQYELKLEMPLFFSKGRGEFKKAKIKIEETKIARSQKSLTVDLKVKYYFNEFENYKTQVKLQREMLTNFIKLFKAEERLILNGESSLFLINSRENKVLEAERKLVELKAKYFKSIYSLQWSAGLLK